MICWQSTSKCVFYAIRVCLFKEYFFGYRSSFQYCSMCNKQFQVVDPWLYFLLCGVFIDADIASDNNLLNASYLREIFYNSENFWFNLIHGVMLPWYHIRMPITVDLTVPALRYTRNTWISISYIMPTLFIIFRFIQFKIYEMEVNSPQHILAILKLLVTPKVTAGMSFIIFWWDFEIKIFLVIY